LRSYEGFEGSYCEDSEGDDARIRAAIAWGFKSGEVKLAPKYYEKDVTIDLNERASEVDASS